MNLKPPGRAAAQREAAFSPPRPGDAGRPGPGDRPPVTGTVQSSYKQQARGPEVMPPFNFGALVGQGHLASGLYGCSVYSELDLCSSRPGLAAQWELQSPTSTSPAQPRISAVPGAGAADVTARGPGPVAGASAVPAPHTPLAAAARCAHQATPPPPRLVEPHQACALPGVR